VNICRYVFLLFVVTLAADGSDAGSSRYMQCLAQEAEIVSHVILSLPGGESLGSTCYFRLIRSTSDREKPPTLNMSAGEFRADGGRRETGLTQNLSGDILTVAFTETGTVEGANSTLRITITTPFLGAKRGTVGGIPFDITWRVYNPEPKQPTDPTPPSGTPVAGRPPR
jgi:hypothetical protein